MNRLKQLIRTDAQRDRLPSTVRKALPIKIDIEGAQEAVLLLHGFTGNPSELLHLGKALAGANYAVSIPRHTGHGTSRADILKTKAEDWLRGAFDAYLDLKAKYPTVHVLGHSMGGLLASAVAMCFDVPKLMLMAPAYMISTKGIRWTPFISHFKKVLVRGRPISEADLSSQDQRRLHEEYWADDLLPPTTELLRLSTHCRRELSRLHSKTFVVVGEKDAVVPPKTADFVKNLAVNVESFDITVMKDAGHLFTFDERAEESARLVLAWLGSAGK